MKVSLNWLKDYVEIDGSAEDVAEILSQLGLAYEGIEYLDDDVVIDVEVTSNRGDCLGHIGVARELAAATGKELKLPVIEPAESDSNAQKLASVEILNPELCRRYTARVIEGVKTGPSPGWLRKRLEAVGMRSVNNVVDATNYAMLETGQPPHAFDYAKINDGKIIVRKALAGEQIVSIDGTKCELNPDMLIIADPAGPVAIAGVMGGLDTEVSGATTSILLEDAYFDPVSVRTTSRRLALPSEAAFRFERIVDIEKIDWASQRTAQLIVQVAGGKVARGVVDIYPGKAAPKEVSLRLSRLNKLLGIDVPAEKAAAILSRLGFHPKRDGDIIYCTVPSWRSDVYREVDLIEEVARVYGYDKIPTEQKIRIEVTPVDSRQRMVELVGKYLNGCGFYETVNVSFIDESTAELFAPSEGGPAGHLAVKDVSRKTANILRQSLLPCLLSVMKSNHNVGNSPCRIYELADTFVPAGNPAELPVERTKLALACDSGFRDIRGIIEGLIGRLDRNAVVTFEPSQIRWAGPGVQILVGGRQLGTAGIFSDAVRNKFDLAESQCCGAELDFELLQSLQAGPVEVKPVPRFPAIKRDLSVIVAEDVPWSAITQAVRENAPAELEDIRFVGIYRGKGIAAGKKSVTLSLLFRDSDGTLRHEMVDEFESKIVARLTESVAAELRTV